MRPSAATTSAVLHGAAVLSLLFLFQSGELTPEPKPSRVSYVQLVRSPVRWLHESGGGQREALPASKGVLPPRAKTRVFTPPTADILNHHPRLPVQQAMVLDAPTYEVQPGVIGDPMGVVGPLSGGRGGPGGIGDGGCCGVGSGNGPGLDGLPPPPRPAKRHLSPPLLVYKVEPEYSDEARKAKFQGVVVVSAEVGPDGRTRKLHVARALGLGLDEKAVEAASLWRFRPAMADGRPVPYSVVIEINFRLL